MHPLRPVVQSNLDYAVTAEGVGERTGCAVIAFIEGLSVFTSITEALSEVCSIQKYIARQ